MNDKENDNIDIIESPIKITDYDQITKIHDKYFLQILNKSDSKKVAASKLPPKNVYFVLKITDNVEIIAKTKNIYNFTDPVDYILPGNSSFYEKFVDNLLKRDENFDMPKEFPPHFPAILQKPKIFSFPKFKPIKTSKSRQAVDKIKYEDEVPNSVPDKYKEFINLQLKKLPRQKIYNEKDKKLQDHSENLLSSKIQSPEILKSRKIIFKTLNLEEDSVNRKIISEEIVKILKILFNDRPIYRYNDLEHQMDEILDNSNISRHRIKLHLPLVAYFCITGPWKKQWIRYGYDPKKHMDAYIYQRLPLKFLKKGFMIYGNKKILDIINNNKDLYLKNKCDYNLGYLTKSFMDFIQVYITDSVHLESIRFDDEFEDECFEIFD
ncbi:General transcription factor 3C polypeptide 5 [Dictyocoela muelleri]|nr:General transcription factor 3C polypeptide 5 [Dictyocoela muelleri]